MRILIVEDHRDTRHTLEAFLVSLGHWVEAVQSTTMALDRLRQDGFDLLLTDVWIGNVSGWNFLQELKASDELPPHVISMSAMPVEDARGPSEAAGCCAHLVKPFRVGELEQALAHACALRTQGVVDG